MWIIKFKTVYWKRLETNPYLKIYESGGNGYNQIYRKTPENEIFICMFILVKPRFI
jgi:hypothetical protein